MHQGIAMAGLAGAILSLLGTICYLRDMRRGHTVPHRGSWFVWAMAAVVAAVSHGADGVSWSLLVLSVGGAGTVVIWFASIWRGTGWLTPTNAVLVGVAVLGIVGWQVSSNPIVASACAAVVDGAGLLAMAPKAWADPRSETASTFALAACTGLLAVVAVPAWEANLLVFPVYFFFGNAAMALLIVMRARTAARAVPLVVTRRLTRVEVAAVRAS